MVLIAVHGTASRLVPAERGTVQLSVEAEHDDRATAVQQVAALHARLVEEAQAFVDAGAATRWSSEQVQARPDRRFEGPGEAPRVVQTASAQLQVRFRDPVALAGWVERTAAEPGVLVQGVAWELTRETRAAAERAMRVAAVQDAVERAEAYASAVGGDGVVLQAVWEAGLRPGATAGQGEHGWVAQAKSRMDAQPGFRLRPEDLEVAASVTADFALGAPTGPSTGD